MSSPVHPQHPGDIAVLVIENLRDRIAATAAIAS